MLMSHKKATIVAETLSRALGSCYHWFTNNKLVMHSGKTECMLITSMLITSKRKKFMQRDFIIHHAGQVIKPSTSVKYLGLKIDSTLSGELNVDSILSKCNARLKFLYRYKNVLKFKTKKLLVSALIQSHFDYTSTAWYFSLNKNLKKPTPNRTKWSAISWT